jgi:hypothetical protein
VLICGQKAEFIDRVNSAKGDRGLRGDYNFAQYLLTYSNPCRIGEEDLNEPQRTQRTQSQRREGRERVGN